MDTIPLSLSTHFGSDHAPGPPERLRGLFANGKKAAGLSLCSVRLPQWVSIEGAHPERRRL
jgi:hypothetical protein